MNKKLLLTLPIIVILLSVGITTVTAQEILPRISTVCETKSGQLFAFNDGFSLKKKCPNNSRRVVLIGERGDKGDKGEQGEKGEKGDAGTLTKQSFYVRNFGSYTAGANDVMTVIYGCDDEDVAVGGGMSSYQGNIRTWRTVKSAPSTINENMHNWETTMANDEGTPRTFMLTVKCLDLPSTSQ